MAVVGQSAAYALKLEMVSAEADSVNKPVARHSRILVVDDDWGVRETLKMLLIAEGYEASAAQDGIEALQQIQRETPTLLLCDLEMPRMSGFELLPIVRRRFPRVAVIAMSGSYVDGAVPEGVTADAFYCKGKQGPPELLRMVADLIRTSSSEEQPR